MARRQSLQRQHLAPRLRPHRDAIGQHAPASGYVRHLQDPGSPATARYFQRHTMADLMNQVAELFFRQCFDTMKAQLAAAAPAENAAEKESSATTNNRAFDLLIVQHNNHRLDLTIVILPPASTVAVTV